MPTTLIDRLLVKSQRTALLLTLFAGIIYAIILILLYPSNGGQVSALVIIPAAIGAWSLGLRNGILTTIGLVLTNFVIFYVFDRNFGDAVGLVLGPGSLSVFLVALIFGALRELLLRLQAQSIQLTQERAALQHEIGERRKAQEELAEINQELDQFAYIVSHDLKAPLRAIDNLADWIAEDLGEDLPGTVQDHLDLLNQRVQRMRDLIDGVLEYSRAGRHLTEPQLVAVDKLLAGVIDSLAPPPGMTITIAPTMPQLMAEKLKLEQVFANLLSNAIKYHDKENGRVDLTVRDAGNFYQFTVSDDGPGIDAEFHDRVFGMFESIFVRDGVDSTGVGLAVVKKIVEDQGGEIYLESTAGEGASFHFTWPKEAPATVLLPTAQSPATR